MNLPPLVISIEQLSMTPSEKDFYEAVYKRSQARFDTFVDKGTVLNNYAHVFQLLSRLRQAADHPYLVLYGPVVRLWRPHILSPPSLALLLCAQFVCCVNATY